MYIGLTGATGFIGGKLIDLALRRGHEIIAFTRNPEARIAGCEMRPFSVDRPPDLRGCEAVVHLAGESVVGLWTQAKKERIRKSRVEGARRIVEAINALDTPPEVFVCGSAIGFYGDSGEAELTETTPPGEGFLSETVRAWEAEALRAERTRTVLLRTGLVLGRGAGTLGVMAPVFRAGLGGQMGDGRQWMSWIHLEDEVRLILFALENLDVQGPLNATAPWPVRNADFTRVLAKTVRRPAIFRVPAFALRLALRDFSHELLDSKRVLPAAALDHGFGFQFSELAPALKDLLG